MRKETKQNLIIAGVSFVSVLGAYVAGYGAGKDLVKEMTKDKTGIKAQKNIFKYYLDNTKVKK